MSAGKSQAEDGEIRDRHSDRESSVDDALDIKPPQCQITLPPKLKRKREKRSKERSSRKESHSKRRHHGSRHSWGERGARDRGEWMDRHRVHHRHHTTGNMRHGGGMNMGPGGMNPRPHRDDRIHEDLRKKLQRGRQDKPHNEEWGEPVFKRERRDPEFDKRREKLLLADRANAIQKEKSRKELEERRKRHEQERRRHKEKKRRAEKQRRQEEEDQKKKSQVMAQPLDINKLGVEDISEEEEEEEEEDDEEEKEESQDSEESSSDSESSANSESSSSESGGSGNEEKNKPKRPSVNDKATASVMKKSDEGDDDEDEDEDEEEEEDDDEEEEEEEGEEEEEEEEEAGSARKSRSRTPSVHQSEDQNMPLQKDQQPENEENASETVESPAHTPVEIDELPPYLPAVMGCRSVEEFNCLNRIEEGTYGVVYRARDKKRNEIVALKRLKMEKEKEGFPITSLREISTLLKAQHTNIVTVREIVVGSNMDKIYIVMDYVEHDLKSLMETMKMKKQMFVFSEVKTLMIQLLRAVAHMHDNWILHRDLKTSNLLLSHKGILKVGDFGLAREYGSPLRNYTPVVVTLWYRAPELLLGQKEYSTHIDMWSVGCIFGELLLMEALFPGKNEVEEINKIFKDLGTPNEKIWPGYKDLPMVKKIQFAEYPYNQLRNRFASQKLTDAGFDLLNRFLTYAPSRRITAESALDHLWLTDEKPAPKDPSMFPTWPAKSELGHRVRAPSPKPPSGAVNFKNMNQDEDILGFHMGADGKINYPGAGFSLKF